MKTKKRYDNQDIIKTSSKKKYNKCHDANCRIAKTVISGVILDQNGKIINPGSEVNFWISGEKNPRVGIVLEIHPGSNVAVSYDDETTNEVLYKFISSDEICVLE